MSQEHSEEWLPPNQQNAEWLRGFIFALQNDPYTSQESLDKYIALLAAAEAREAGRDAAVAYRMAQLEEMNSGLARKLSNISIACKPSNLKAPDGKEWTFHPSDEVVRQFWEYLSSCVMEAMSSEASAPTAAEVIAVAKKALECFPLDLIAAVTFDDNIPTRIKVSADSMRLLLKANQLIAAWEVAQR